MKIVHVINSLATGGAERVLVDLASCGNEFGHEVSIITLVEREGVPREISKLKGIEVINIGKRLVDPRIPFRLNKVTKDADVIHVHLFPSFYYSCLLPGSKIYTEHSSFNRRRGKWVFRLIERVVYGRYSRIVAISNGVKDALESHLSEIGSSARISFAPNGITEEFFEVNRQYSQKPRKLVIIGSLRPLKQHWIALEAMQYLKGFTLDIAGDGPLRSQLEQLATELGVQDRVHFLGNVTDVPKLLECSDLLISTSKYEGMSTVAMEAQATGLPVVGPKVPGIEDVVIHGQTGMLFEGFDPRTIADTIKQALSEDVYVQLGQQARAHSIQYSIKKAFERLLKIYREVYEAR